MDLNYLLFLQKIREATGGIFNDFSLQISDLSYGIFVWLTACIFFWAVNKSVYPFQQPAAAAQGTASVPARCGKIKNPLNYKPFSGFFNTKFLY